MNDSETRKWPNKSLCEWSVADSDLVKLHFGWHSFSRCIIPLYMKIRQFVEHILYIISVKYGVEAQLCPCSGYLVKSVVSAFICKETFRNQHGKSPQKPSIREVWHNLEQTNRGIMVRANWFTYSQHKRIHVSDCIMCQTDLKKGKKRKRFRNVRGNSSNVAVS